MKPGIQYAGGLRVADPYRTKQESAPMTKKPRGYYKRLRAACKREARRQGWRLNRDTKW